MNKNLTTIIITAVCSICITAIASAKQAAPNSGQKSGSTASESGAAQQTASTSNKPGGGTGGGALSAADRAFIQEAANGGTKEVAMGQMAQQHGQSADVKAFGGRLVNDHTRANNELIKIAQNRGIQLKARKPSHSWTSDQQFITMMVADHQKTLAAFQREAKNGSDPDVKTFAQKNSAVIAQHLQTAQKLSKQGGSQTGAGQTGSTTKKH